jgi:hypothetical protein
MAPRDQITMGCFNFDCVKCGEGVGRDEDGNEWKGREYFNAPVRIRVPLKDGRSSVFLEGKYDGYGEVLVAFGTDTLVFLPKQFQEYWDIWQVQEYWDIRTTNDQYVAEEVYCEDCMKKISLTSRAAFDGKDFILVQNYMATHEKPPGWMNPHQPSKWNTAPPVPVAADPLPSPVSALPPAPWHKEADLLRQVAEMKDELERLRLFEARVTALEAEANTLRKDLHVKNEKLEKIRHTLNS